MEQNKLSLRSCIAIACFALTICLMLYSLFTNELILPYVITSLISIFSAVYAIAYLFLGSRKMVAKYYQWANLLFAVASLATIIEITVTEEINIAILYASFYTVHFALLVSMTFAQNLGKRNSLFYTIIGCIICLFLHLFALLHGDTTLDFTSFFFIRTLSWVLLSLGAVWMVEAKYADKSARGSN